MSSIYEPPVPYSEPYQLVEGVALPVHEPGAAPASEHRGEVALAGEHLAPSLLEKLQDDRDGLTAHERQILAAALRAYDTRKRLAFVKFDQVGGETDGTTGNVVIPFYTAPAGAEAHLTNVFVDAPKSAAITAAAPLANAAIFSTLAIAGSGGLDANAADADNLRAGGVASLPVAAAGAVVPGQWTWNDSNAPVVWGGETAYYLLHGGSIAAAKSLQLQISFRVNVYM